jgi:lipopolysaccharide export LptBFGC system permease protein LptF
LKERETFKAQQQRWYAQMLFSGIMALASLYVILSKKYPDEVNKFGYSTIAFIMGFWLKGM